MVLATKRHKNIYKTSLQQSKNYHFQRIGIFLPQKYKLQDFRASLFATYSFIKILLNKF